MTLGEVQFKEVGIDHTATPRPKKHRQYNFRPENFPWDLLTVTLLWPAATQFAGPKTGVEREVVLASRGQDGPAESLHLSPRSANLGVNGMVTYAVPSKDTLGM